MTAFNPWFLQVHHFRGHLCVHCFLHRDQAAAAGAVSAAAAEPAGARPQPLSAAWAGPGGMHGAPGGDPGVPPGGQRGHQRAAAAAEHAAAGRVQHCVDGVGAAGERVRQRAVRLRRRSARQGVVVGQAAAL